MIKPHIEMMKIVLIVIVLAVQSIKTPAQNIPAKLEEFLDAYAKQYKFMGSALVAQKGKVLLRNGYGFRNDSIAAHNDANTIFQIGSVTKQFTSAVILRLQEQKKLSVKDKLSKYFTGLPHADKITIENLLNHTSGIYNYTNDASFMANEITKPHTREVMMALFSSKPLDFEPGTSWNYSNSGYMLLGYLIENITRKPYERVVREMILEPLQMNNSGFDFTHLQSEYKATGYSIFDDQNKVRAPTVDSSVSFSAGALYSTIDNLYKWERAVSANKILSRDSWKIASTPFRNKYGYGWQIDSLYNRTVVSHGGGIHGFNSNLFRIPEEDIAIIILSNKNTPYLNAITKGLAAIMLNEKYELPSARVQIALPDSVLKQYVGEYELSPAFKIAITFSNGGLKAQATGQPAFDLYPEKEDFFFLKVVDAQIKFQKAQDGKIEEMILYQNGRTIPGRKLQ